MTHSTPTPDPERENESAIPIEPPEHEPAPTLAGRPPVTAGMSEDELETIERDEGTPPDHEQSGVVESPPDGIAPEAFGSPGRLGWRFPLIAGGAALLGAVVLAGVYPPAETAWWMASLRQLVDAPLYAWLGVGAVVIAARVEERPFGGIQFVGARMALAVGVFAFFWQLTHAVLVAEDWALWLRWPTAVVLGGGFYAAWLGWSFRLDRQGVSILGAVHLLAWFVLLLFRVVA